jgi:hypothetical protein
VPPAGPVPPAGAPPPPSGVWYSTITEIRLFDGSSGDAGFRSR